MGDLKPFIVSSPIVKKRKMIKLVLINANKDYRKFMDT